MPLSEHEQRLLDQLEQQLNADDPTFASSMASEPKSPQTTLTVRNIVLGTLTVLVGLGVIIAGVASKLIIVGVAGFIVAAAGVYLATLQKDSAGLARDSLNRGAKSPKKKSNFMRGLEDKWDERRNHGL